MATAKSAAHAASVFTQLRGNTDAQTQVHGLRSSKVRLRRGFLADREFKHNTNYRRVAAFVQGKSQD